MNTSIENENPLNNMEFVSTLLMYVLVSVMLNDGTDSVRLTLDELNKLRGYNISFQADRETESITIKIIKPEDILPFYQTDTIIQ